MTFTESRVQRHTLEGAFPVAHLLLALAESFIPMVLCLQVRHHTDPSGLHFAVYVLCPPTR